MKKEKHPIICTYKTTNNCNFPLVMIIGRESNNNIGYGHSVGHYDFCQFSSGGFWNSSYSFIAKSAEINNMEFKKLCTKNKSSPIIFTNVSSVPIPNEIQSKAIIRKKISREIAEKHIDIIFSKKIIKRVKFAIVSGAQKKEFSDSANYFIKQLRKRKIEFVEVPFFFGRNYKKIKKAVSKSQRNKIETIVNTWKNNYF